MDGVIDTFTLTGWFIGLKTFSNKVDNPAIFQNREIFSFLWPQIPSLTLVRLDW